MSIWLLGTKLPSSNKISSVEFLDKAQENSPSEGDSIVINLTEGSAFPTCNATDEIESIALVVTNNNNTISYDVQICFSNTFNTLDTTNHVNTADMQADPNSCSNLDINCESSHDLDDAAAVRDEADINNNSSNMEHTDSHEEIVKVKSTHNRGHPPLIRVGATAARRASALQRRVSARQRAATSRQYVDHA